VSETLDQARSLLAARLVELHDEERKLRNALSHLGESGSQGSDRPRRKPQRRRKARRARRGERREQLLSAIKDKPGIRPAELAKAMGVKPSQVHGLIRKARAEKQIVKKDEGYAVKV
jgi:hypothetical protein